MEESIQRVASYQEVSQKLGKLLIKLYGEKIFPRQGKVFADMLFQTGVEAGAYLAALNDIEERSVKVDLATNALIKLNQADYLIDIMREAKYYTAVQVVEIDEFLQGLIKAMRDLLNTANSHIRAEANRKAAMAQQPIPVIVQPQPAVQIAPATPANIVAPATNVIAAPAPAPKRAPGKPKVNPDPDGFLIPAEEAPKDGNGEENGDKT